MGCRLLHLLLVGLALLGAAGTSTAAAQSEGLRGALAEGKPAAWAEHGTRGCTPLAQSSATADRPVLLLGLQA